MWHKPGSPLHHARTEGTNWSHLLADGKWQLGMGVGRGCGWVGGLQSDGG